MRNMAPDGKHYPLTLKQESFVYAYMELGIATDAYRSAYNADNMGMEAIRVEASRLLDNPNVSLLIESLKAKISDETVITVASLTAELEKDRLLARENNQASAATSATMGIAKLHGLLIEKNQTLEPNRVDNMTDAQLEAIAKKGLVAVK